MKHLTRAKHIVLVLLIVSAIMVVVMQVAYQGVTGVFFGVFYGWNIAEEYIFTTAMTLVAIVQCMNLSIALYILSILDKHLMPVYS